MSAESDRKGLVMQAKSVLLLQKKHLGTRRDNAARLGVVNTKLDILNHDHCANCTAAQIMIKNGKVSIGCSVGMSPAGLWNDLSLPTGTEPECLYYEPIVPAEPTPVG